MRVLPASEVIKATPRTRIIRLDLGGSPFPFMAGQAVLVGLHGASLQKPYSLASSPARTAAMNALELLVQIDDTGLPDPHLERLTPETLVDVHGPFGAFGLPADLGGDDVLFVAGGTGIAPLRSMLWDLVEREAPNRLSLIYSARSRDEFAYETELRELAARGRLDLRLTVTRDETIGWIGPRGRVDAGLIQSVVHGGDTLCVLCGPPPMIDSVTGLLRSAGVSGRNILTETFST